MDSGHYSPCGMRNSVLQIKTNHFSPSLLYTVECLWMKVQAKGGKIKLQVCTSTTAKYLLLSLYKNLQNVPLLSIYQCKHEIT